MEAIVNAYPTVGVALTEVGAATEADWLAEVEMMAETLPPVVPGEPDPYAADPVADAERVRREQAEMAEPIGVALLGEAACADHTWPPELDGDAACLLCGQAYLEWSR